jgi:hypothetical protein
MFCYIIISGDKKIIYVMWILSSKTMPSRGSGLENGGEALKVGELMKWTQQWVGTSFRTGSEMEQSLSIDKQINIISGDKKIIYVMWILSSNEM